jgi:cyanophycinase
MPRAITRTCRPTLPALIAGLLLAASAGDAASQGCARPCVGPRHGAIIAAGGGELDGSIYRRFVKLAGGPDAKIVLIPTAGARYGSHDGWTAIEELKKAGVEQLEVLHTRSRAVADLAAFAAPLKEATGVWFSGGRQYRLVDVYLRTETHRELQAVLERGGIVGGNSAGASALASYLVRGSQDTELVMARDKDAGFGFLRNVAIDQHILRRGRENNLLDVLKQYPHLLGVGLSEGSAILITRDLAEVLGNRVAVYDATDPLSLIPLRWLDPGDVYDLGARRIFLEKRGRDPATR